MAINFPNSPTIGQSYELEGQFYVWDGTVWRREDALQNVIQYIKSGTAAQRPVVSSPTLYYNTDLDGLELYYPEVDAWEVVNTFTTQQDATAASGQALYTSPGTHTWVCPLNVYSVDVVCVGGGGSGGNNSAGGGGGGGGGLGYKNSISVTPGTSYTVVVGAGGAARVSAPQAGEVGGDSYFISTITVKGGGGSGGGSANGVSATGGDYFPLGGNGGNGGVDNNAGGGGGGAGGYSGSGGNGGTGYGGSGLAGTGGAGGGGGGADYTFRGGAGGGVGVLGEGTSGSGGAGSTSSIGSGGTGGSNGSSGSNGVAASPGVYGGGGSGNDQSSYSDSGSGGSGAVRIIWGAGRAFPSTNTGDV